MPKTKFQGLIFGVIMSVTMALGMEGYDVSCGLHTFQYHSCGKPASVSAGDMGRYCAEKLSHGLFLECVCCRPLYPASVSHAVSETIEDCRHIRKSRTAQNEMRCSGLLF